MPDRIFQIAASGIETTDVKIKSLTENLVNARTPGFKESDVVVGAFSFHLDRAKKLNQAKVAGVFRNHTPGSLISTGKATDLALAGQGFFAVETPFGEAYTRDGRFTFDKEGRLLTLAGNYQVLGIDGPVEISPKGEFTVLSDGRVVVDNEIVADLKVVSFKDPSLLSSGNGVLFSVPENLDIKGDLVSLPQVLQGYVETSTVNPISQMADLTQFNRYQGINTKVVQVRDSGLSRMFEIAKPSQ